LIKKWEQERDNKLRSLVELSKEDRESPEYRIYKELLKIKTGFSICRLNFFNLKREIAIYYSNVPDLYSVRTIERTRFQNKVTAAIYNFVTSAQSFKEYNFPKSYFLETDLSCFMKELRNYIAHSEPLNLTSHVKYVISEPDYRAESFSINDFKNELETSIVNSKKKLDHKVKALNYIKTNQVKNNIHLNELINDYFISVEINYNERLLNFIKVNENLFNSLLVRSERISKGMEEVNYYSTVIPLNQIKIRYLKHLIYLSNK